MAVSVEAAVVEWARAAPLISAIVTTRVATNLPNEPTLPFMVVSLVGGGPTDGETPTDLYNVQLDCYAATQSAADDLYRALIQTTRNLSNKRGNEGHVYALIVSGVRRADEGDPVDRYRYIVDAFAHVHE